MSGSRPSSLRRVALALLLLVPGCGGEKTPTGVDPDPTPTTRAVAAAAGDGQSAGVGQAVAVPPAVRVTDGGGNPVSGVSVTFAVTAGGGAVTGAAASTGADGVATVGSWTLGAVGTNTLTATTSGATSGSPTVFTATGQEIVLAPASDTTLSGVVTGTRIEIPAGVTVTVVDSLVLRADSTVEIRGAIRGACTPVRVEAGAELVVRGTVDNACDEGDPEAALDLVGRGGFDVDSAFIRSSGDVRIANDPTLTDGDFPGAVGATPVGTANQVATRRCRLRSVVLRPYPAQGRNGISRSGTAGAGRDGRDWRVDCRGTLRVEGGVEYRGQHGGDGGTGTHAPASIDAYAEGGAGGRGGKMYVRATEAVVFSGILNEIVSGNGGRGGDASATSSPSGGGVTGPSARAVGGAGGEPGLFGVFAPVIDFTDQVDLVIGHGGDGGDAEAFSAAGLDAQGSSVAQGGGPAFAMGGAGGGTPDDTLAAHGGVQISGLEHVVVSGGDGGHGGSATAVGGIGGAGSGLRPDGGRGGASWAEGGDGGTSRLKDHTLTLFGRGGDGGDAFLAGAKGGPGATRCGLPNGLLPGGVGGDGGSLDATHGVAGSGATAGVDGNIQLDRAGNGGNGGNGEPRGTGGSGGAQTLSKNASTIGGNSLSGGQGFECVRPNLQMIEGVTNGTVDTSQPCPTPHTTFNLVSFSPDPVDYVVAVVDVPGFAVAPATGQTPPAPGPTTDWTIWPIQTVRDLCTMATAGALVEGRIEITFTLGPTTVTKTIPVRHEFR